MRENYVKIFQTMYTGSLYGAGMHVFAVWGWILAHKDENGLVEVNPRLAANELGGTVKQVEEAIGYLCAPDPNSRSTEEEGRRLVKVSQFGYRVVNDTKYRDRGGDRTEYWKAYRQRRKQERNSCARCAQLRATERTHAKAKEEASNPPPTPPGGDARFADFWKVYPKKVAKAQALKAWTKIKPSAELAAKIIAAVGAYAASPAWMKDGGQYIPHGSTFLNQRRWEDELREAVGSPTPDLPPLQRDAAGKTPRDYLLEKFNPMGVQA